jgi:hypothetical protein
MSIALRRRCTDADPKLSMIKTAYVQHGRSVYIRTAEPWEDDGSQDRDSLLRTNHKSFRTRNGRSEQTKPMSRRERITI